MNQKYEYRGKLLEETLFFHFSDCTAKVKLFKGFCVIQSDIHDLFAFFDAVHKRVSVQKQLCGSLGHVASFREITI